MNRRRLLNRIAETAGAKGENFAFQRAGGSHDIWRCGTVPVSIPRHNEINDLTAEAIFKMIEPVLGPRWWR